MTDKPKDEVSWSFQNSGYFPLILTNAKYVEFEKSLVNFKSFETFADTTNKEHFYVQTTSISSSKKGNIKISLCYSPFSIFDPVKADKYPPLKKGGNLLESLKSSNALPAYVSVKKKTLLFRTISTYYILGTDYHFNDISSRFSFYDQHFFDLSSFMNMNSFSKFELKFSNDARLEFNNEEYEGERVEIGYPLPALIIFTGQGESKYVYNMETFFSSFLRHMITYEPQTLVFNSKFQYLINKGVDSNKKIISLFGITQSGKSSVSRAWLQAIADPTLIGSNPLYKNIDTMSKATYLQIGEPERSNRFARGVKQGSVIDWINVFDVLLSREGDFFIIDSLRTFATLSSENLASGGISAELVNLLTIWNTLIPRLDKTLVLLYNPLTPDRDKQNAAKDFFLSSCDVVYSFSEKATTKKLDDDTYLITTTVNPATRKAATDNALQIVVKVKDDIYKIMDLEVTTNRNKSIMSGSSQMINV